MPIERFLEWNYDTGIVTEYKRLGNCNHCSACCHRIIACVFIKPGRSRNPRNGSASTDGVGVWNELNLGRWSYYFGNIKAKGDYNGCQALVDNMCSNHNNKDKICSGWPFSPSNTEEFPNCGYSFEKIGEWSIESINQKDKTVTILKNGSVQ